jgi:hypothetical protein
MSCSSSRVAAGKAAVRFSVRRNVDGASAAGARAGVTQNRGLLR